MKSDIKQIAKRLRRHRVNAMNISLVHILINIRSHSLYSNIYLKSILKDKSLDRNYGIKHKILSSFALESSQPNFNCDLFYTKPPEDVPF